MAAMDVMAFRHATFSTLWAGQALRVYAETDSTNLCGRRWLAEGAPHGALVIAGVQTGGRGRLQRSWSSPPGGLYLTLLLRPEFPPQHHPRITFAAALAVVEAIGAACALQPLVKWPNDVVVQGRKVCGILLEGSGKGLCVGIGINVAQVFSGEAATAHAASLEQLTGREVDALALLDRLLSAFENRYCQCADDAGFSALRTDMAGVSATLGRRVLIAGTGNAVGNAYEAEAVGIDEDGALLVCAGGELRTVVAGDVSVRGLMGYVDGESAPDCDPAT